MPLTQGLGATISAVASNPATEDETGYAALTFVEIGHVEDVPSYGPEHDKTEFVPLKTGIKDKFHGAVDYGSVVLPMAMDRSNAGQNVLTSALDSKAVISFKIAFFDGSVDYIQGKVFSFKRGASIGKVVMAEATLEFTTKVIEVAA